MRILVKAVLFLVLAFITIVVFRGIFLGSIYWGDAPHFYPETLKQFQSEPLTWTSLGNAFGGLNLTIWLSPLMFLWRWIPPQSLFIFPAIILSLIGPILLARYLKLSKTVQFFSSLVYTFNTYFLLLIDGGQMGVALSYGFFPLTLLFLKKLIDKPGFKNFYLALLFLFLNGLADPRIALIAIVTSVVWNIIEFKKFFVFVPLGVGWLLLNAFWVAPFLMNKNPLSSLNQIDITIVKWFDPLLLFSPHWPDNLFGRLNHPPLYFLGVPFLVFAGFLISKKPRDYSLLWTYLIFVCLSVIPIGIVFRDSTKFFIPVILFAGILIGKSVEVFKKPIFAILAFFYLLFLIYPAVLGQMNFVLSGRTHTADFLKIYENLKNNGGFYRTAWFSERHPMTFETEGSPALDTKDLTKFLPFASLNVGEDPFNFLNNNDFVNAFRTLGIRYLILSGSPREISKAGEEQKNWSEITSLVERTKGLEKVDWGISIPVYKVSGTYPHFFSVDKLIGVVGAPISTKYPTVYFEDGKFRASVLQNVDPNSFVIYFNGKTKEDLMMSLLQRYFLFPKDAVSSQWAVFSHDQYLKYKYQLLIREINFNDLDYGGGIAFSTIKGEKMIFRFNVPQDGEYIVAERSMTSNQPSFSWEISSSRTLSKGKFDYTLTNNSDLEVVNAVALIPFTEFSAAEEKLAAYLKNFKVVDLTGLENLAKISNIDIEKVDTLKYDLSHLVSGSWVIFTDNYDERWQLENGDKTTIHVPVYSMVNGYYIDSSDNSRIQFLGQRYFRIGVYISGASLATLISIFIVYEKFLRRGPKD